MQVYTNYFGETLPVKVPDGRLTSIHFVLADGQEFTVKDGGDKLQISTVNGRLSIEPGASNVIQVKEVD